METFFVSEENKFCRIGSKGQFHKHVYKQLLHIQIPKAAKAQKYSQVMSVFLRFRDLCAQKMLVNCWWTWHLV